MQEIPKPGLGYGWSPASDRLGWNSSDALENYTAVIPIPASVTLLIANDPWLLKALRLGFDLVLRRTIETAAVTGHLSE